MKHAAWWCISTLIAIGMLPQSELDGVKSQLADSLREVQRLDSELSAARSDVTNLKSRVTELIAQVRVPKLSELRSNSADMKFVSQNCMGR